MPNNDLTMRLEAVRQPLSEMIDGEPAFLLSPTCKMLRRGFNSGYRYRRMKIAIAERYDDKPEKNEYSHVHDALQYVEIGGGERTAILGRKRERDEGASRGQVRAIDEDYPEGVYDGERRSRRGRQAFAVE